MNGRTKVGDRVVYLTFADEPRCGTVIGSYADVSNGLPGFDMECDDGLAVWGYDAQIVAINTEARA